MSKAEQVNKEEGTAEHRTSLPDFIIQAGNDEGV
jgi:hypothetical protein